MTGDAKLGLLSGLAAVVLVAVVYYQKSDAAKTNSIQQQTRDKGTNQKLKRTPASVDGSNVDDDPIIHIPNRTPTTKPDVFIRPEIVD